MPQSLPTARITLRIPVDALLAPNPLFPPIAEPLIVTVPVEALLTATLATDALPVALPVT
jgi:hypothetical protein